MPAIALAPSQKAYAATATPFEDFVAYCDGLPIKQDNELSTLTDDQLREALTRHFINKHP